MRISTNQIFGQGLKSIQDVTSQTQKTQLQISTGKQVVTPADDPVASTRILELKQELALNTQFQRNIELAEGRLKLQDDLLGSIDSVVQRIRELAVTAGNGALNETDIQSIKAEVEERLEQLAGLLNTQEASGEYVFAGHQGGVQPFQKNVSGAFEYRGDEGTRFVQIEPSVRIASTVNGKDVFEDVESATNTFFTFANPNNQADPPGQITSGQIVDQDAYDAFYPEDMTIVFNSPTDFTVTESSTGRVILANVPYTPNQPVVANGVQFEINGSPVTGDSFFVESTAKQGLLTTVEKFIYGLNNYDTSPEGRAVFDGVVASAIANLDNAETSILETRSQLGARLNTIDTTREQLADVEILTQEILNNIEALDYAEAISLLSVQQFTLDAAYSSYAQITSLSLFDQL